MLGTHSGEPFLIPECCIGYRSEVRKSLGKRAVGDILARRHIELYGEDQNGETSVAATISVPQEVADARFR